MVCLDGDGTSFVAGENALLSFVGAREKAGESFTGELPDEALGCQSLIVFDFVRWFPR